MLPLSAVLSGLLDFAVASVVLAVLLVWYGIMPTVAITLVPAFLLLAVMTATGVGLWLSALNAMYRDVRHLMPFLIQFWMFASPVAYPSTLVTKEWRWLYAMNPLTSVIDGFRWSLTGTNPPANGLLAISVVVMLVLLVGGLVFFQRMEETVADIV